MMDDGWHFVGSGGGDDWHSFWRDALLRFRLPFDCGSKSTYLSYLERLITLFARAVLPQYLRHVKSTKPLRGNCARPFRVNDGS